MALLDIFLNLFDGYGTSGLGPPQFFLFLAAAIFSTVRMAIHVKRALEADGDEKIMIFAMILVCLFGVVAGFLEVGLIVMIFGSWKSPLELIAMAEGTHGLALWQEGVLIALVALLLLALFHLIAPRRFEGKGALTFCADNFPELAMGAWVLGFGIWGWTNGGVAAVSSDLLTGIYLYSCFHLLIKIVLTVFNILMVALFARSGTVDQQKGTALTRLKKRMRGRYSRRVILWLLIGLVLGAMMLPAYTSEVIGKRLPTDTDKLHDARMDYVYLTDPVVLRVEKGYLGNGDLWLIQYDRDSVLFGYASAEETQRLEEGNLSRFKGKLLTGARVRSDFDDEIRLDGRSYQVLDYAVDQLSTGSEDNFLTTVLLLITGVPWLVSLSSLVFLIFPLAGKEGAQLRNTSPRYRELVAQLEQELASGGELYRKDGITVTRNLILNEGGVPFQIVPVGEAQGYFTDFARSGRVYIAAGSQTVLLDSRDPQLEAVISTLIRQMDNIWTTHP